MHMECQPGERANKMIDCNAYLCRETAEDHKASVQHATGEL